MNTGRVLNFNENAFTKKHNELKNKVDNYSKAITELGYQTEGEVTELSSFKLERYALSKTGFKSIEMSMKALDLSDLYMRVRNIEAQDVVSNSDGIVYEQDGALHINTGDLREVYTTRFHVDDEAIIDALQNVVEASQGVSSYVLENSIYFNRGGGISINMPKLNSVLQQIRRSERSR